MADILISLTGILLLFPFLLLICIWIRAGSPGPVIFRQQRIGKGGVPFTLYKFRTMYTDADRKGLITVGNDDPRITPAGKFLRRYKIDELPQLWNVLCGQMSLVGPRPEVKKYTDRYPPKWKMIILSVKPGITDMASIVYSEENEMLNTGGDPEQHYMNVIVPAKFRLNLVFIENAGIRNYLRILMKTLMKLLKH